jgi:aromatic-L-amino-acid/L-tryptophan decarboxylase
MGKRDALRYRIAPLEMTPSEFRKVGRQLVERIAEFLCTLPGRPVTPQVLFLKRVRRPGTCSRKLPISCSSIPPSTAIRWIAELIGYPTDCGGLLVSGGNMGNFVGFLAARRAKASWDARTTGLMGEGARHLRVYTSSETHTWIQKATDMFGLGTDAIRWIPVDEQLRLDVSALPNQIQADIEAGDVPFLVIGTAGTVSTGAVDPLPEIASICREYDLWFHVDGAYGAFAALLLHENQGIEVPADLEGISLADSVAVDPHKWLYAPKEGLS